MFFSRKQSAQVYVWSGLFSYYLCLRVGEAGIEPAFGGYEPPVVPFHHSPIWVGTSIQ